MSRCSNVRHVEPGLFDHLVGDGEQARRKSRDRMRLAVLRLITNSNLADCMTGKSAGF